MKPRAHIIIIKIGARRKSVPNGWGKYSGLSNSVWNVEHIFVTVYALPSVGYIMNSGGYEVLPEPAHRTPHFPGSPITYIPTVCCGFFRTGIGSSDRSLYFETSESKSRVHP